MSIRQQTTVTVLRAALLVTLVVGNAGTAVELLLLKHTDGVWQLIPLVLIGLTLLILATVVLAVAGMLLTLFRILRADLGTRVRIRCFIDDPSVASSLKFLRKTPWARAKVESLYLYVQRKQAKKKEDPDGV